MSEAVLIDVGDLELAAAAGAYVTVPADEIESLEQAVADFEKALLVRFYPQYPSTRKLAERLGASHSAIATRLRKYGMG